MSQPPRSSNPRFRTVRLQHVMREVRREVCVQPNTVYREIGVRSHGKGVFHKEPITGDLLGNKRVFWLKPGTLVFNIVFAWERAVAVLSEAESGMIGSHRFPTYEMVPGQADANFLKYYFTTGYGHFLLELNSPGAAGRNKTLDQSSLLKEEVRLPPATEQRAIAEFLGRKTAVIDDLIAKKERLLGLLAEKRAALIHRAVTKGLDPSVPMKDSGVPWIGEIPAHWGVKRLKHVTHFVTSGPRGWGEFYADEGPLFLRITNVARDSVDLLLSEDRMQRVAPPTGAEGTRTLASPGDVLITITADLGSVGVVPGGLGEAYISQHVALCRPTGALVPRLIAYAVASPWGAVHYQLSMNGGTKVGLNLDDVRNTPIPVPPMSEQDRLVGAVDEAMQRLNNLKARLNEQLDHLREYRQALITAAVTGQLDLEGARSGHAPSPCSEQPNLSEGAP